MRRRIASLVSSVAVLVAVSACTQTPSGSSGVAASSTSSTATSSTARSSTVTPTSSARSQSGSPVHTVFVVMMENTDWSSVKGSRSWPYVNSLLPQAAHAENYRSGLHPSLPNYVELEGGQTFGETDGSFLPGDHPIRSTAHLTTQLTAAGVDWKYWAENLPGNGSTCNTSDPGTPYSLDHDAQVYFDDVRRDNSYCIAHERPYGEFSRALAGDRVSGYNLIVPNDYHQGEKPAPGSQDPHAQADSWLREQIPLLQASAAYRNGALILILWDESAGTDDRPSGLVVLGKYARAGYGNDVAYSHASTLRTMQEIFGLRPWLGNAARATDLGDLLTVRLGS